MKPALTVVIVAMVLGFPLPASADTDVAQTLRNFKACISAAVGRTPRGVCESAYASFAIAKAQLRIAIAQGENDPAAMSALNQTTASITGDYGVSLTPREAVVAISAWQYMIAMMLGESGVMSKSPADPQNHADFVRAVHVGNEVLSSRIDSPMVRKLKALVRLKWADVQAFANWRKSK